MVEQQSMTVEQVKAGLAAAKAIGAREFCMASLAAAHGLRASELAAVRVSDLNLREGTLKVKPGKNSMPSVEAVNAQTMHAIQAWLAAKPESEFLFPSRDSSLHLSRVAVYNIFVGIAKAANLPSTSRAPHAWRHSIGQVLADNGVAVQTIAKVLRHRSINSTMHYFKVKQSVADAAKTNLGW